MNASKLFHAVVVAGAALTGCAGPAKPAAGNVTNATSSTAVGGEAPNAVQPSEAAGPGKCPPGSERPYPPCYWIK